MASLGNWDCIESYLSHFTEQYAAFHTILLILNTLHLGSILGVGHARIIAQQTMTHAVAHTP